MIKIFEVLAGSYRLDSDQIEAGIEMLTKWSLRMQANPPHMVVSCESKETFELKAAQMTAAGLTYRTIPFTYIFDRLDMTEDGGVEVIDYKTYAMPMSPAELRTKIQVRAYALAVQMVFRDNPPPSIWVTYDLLQHEPISMKFSREENLATWRYFQELYVRILESDGTKETVNNECRWCVRKSVCESLRRHVVAGGNVGLSAEAQARRLAEVQNSIRALRNAEVELETALVEWLEESERTEATFDDGVRVFLKPSKRRTVDSERVAKVLGKDLVAKWADLGVTRVDEILKKETSLTPQQIKELKALIRTTTSAKLSIAVPSVIDDI